MRKDNVLFSLAALLPGLIIGFVFANSVNQRMAQPGAVKSQAATLPPDHPPITSNGSDDQQGPAMAEVQAAIKLAKDQPDNFDAQMKAAELYYQIQRFDESIQFLKRANQLRPNEYEPVVNLGNVYFDSGRYEEAEKWYTEALKIKPDDVNVRTDLGLTFFFRTPPDIDRAIKEYRASLERDPAHVQTLQNLAVALIKKGDAEQAQATLTRLERINVNNPALVTLRTDLAALRSSTKAGEAEKTSIAVKDQE